MKKIAVGESGYGTSESQMATRTGGKVPGTVRRAIPLGLFLTDPSAGKD